MSHALRIDAIDALLPQTQCGKCGHPGCRPYAEGIAQGEAINKCPPGGNATLHALADLLQVPVLPLEQPAIAAQVAVIREAECIGCTKCIQACPVDAILGAAKQMHTVIHDECSGCELCLAPCPVDCIDLITLAPAEAEVQRNRAPQFRNRHQARLTRLARDDERRRTARSARNTQVVPRPAISAAPAPSVDLKRLKIEAAMAKVAYDKARKQVDAHGDSPFASQLDGLRSASEQAAAALLAAQTSSGQAQPAPSAGELALKQAKIDLASHRMALKAAERRGQEEALLAPLRAAYAAAERALHQAEQDCGKPAPQRMLVEKAGVSPALRQLKTDLAYARADLSKLQRTPDPDSAALHAAQQRLKEAEQRLQAHISAEQSA